MCPTVGHISTFSEEATIIKPKQTDFRSAALMWAALSAAVVWLAAIAAYAYEDGMKDRKSTRLNSSHITRSRMPSSA